MSHLLRTILSVQFAKWKGAHVIGTCSTKNVGFVYVLEADKVIAYTKERFEKTVSDVDLVLDTIGGKTLEQSFSVGKTPVHCGRAIPRKAQEHQIHIVKPTVQLMPSPEEQQQISQQIAQMIAEGTIKSEINKIFPLHEVQQAHELSQTGHDRRRIVLQIKP